MKKKEDLRPPLRVSANEKQEIKEYNDYISELYKVISSSNKDQGK